MNHILIVLFCLISLSGFSQKGLTSLESEQLPENMEFKGDFICCSKWEDSLGLNYLILSQSKITKPAIAIAASEKYELISFDGKVDTVYGFEADFRDKEIYAFHYVLTMDSTYLVWKLLDFVKECPLDLTVDYLTEKPVVTDLDSDGICETWLVYWLGCRSDVSALDMKLIMHQGKKKYAIRGTRKIVYGQEPDQFDGGKMKKDASFSKLPKKINEFAEELWNKYNIEELETTCPGCGQ